MYGNLEENIPTGDIQKSFKTRQSVSTHATLTACTPYSTVIKKLLLQEYTSKLTRLLVYRGTTVQGVGCRICTPSSSRWGWERGATVNL